MWVNEIMTKVQYLSNYLYLYLYIYIHVFKSIPTSVCVHIRMWRVCIRLSMNVCSYLFTYAYIHLLTLCMYIYKQYIYTHTCMYACMYRSKYAGKYARMYVCMYVCMHA